MNILTVLALVSFILGAVVALAGVFLNPAFFIATGLALLVASGYNPRA